MTAGSPFRPERPQTFHRLADWQGRLLRVVLPDADIEVARRLPSPVVYDPAEMR